MVPNKLNPKYYGLIWLALIFATFVCNFYDFFTTASLLATHSAELARVDIAVNVVEMIFGDVVVPTLLVVLFAFIVYQFGYSRYVRCISRRDFIYFVMLFISASRLLMGFVYVFALVDDNIFYCATDFLPTLCNGAAMLIMFFTVFRRLYRFNPAEESNAFRVWATWFMIGGGFKAVIGNGSMLLLMDSPELLLEIGFDISAVDPIVITAGCATGMAIYFAYLVAIIVIGELLKKKARMFVDPTTRGDYYDTHAGAPYTVRTDAGDVFGDDLPSNGSNDDDKVFEEFDI